MREKSFSKLKNSFSSIFKKIWGKFTLILLILLILDLIIGGFLFKAYCVKPKETSQIAVPALGIDRALLKNVSGYLTKKKAAFKQAADKIYLDPFRVMGQ